MLDAIVSAVGNLVGTNQTNEAAWDRAQSAQQFSAEQFATRYQTTVKDLKASGLNPMLAYSQGPGTSPTGVQAPVQNALGYAVEGYQKGKAVSSAALLQAEQAKQAESQVTLNSANAAKSVAEAKVADEQAKLLALQQPKAFQETKTSEELAKAYIQQAGASAAQAAKAYEEIKNIAQNNQNLRAELLRLQQANDKSAPEAEIAKKYPTFYYIFHKLMPSLSGSIGKPYQFGR